MVTLLAGVLPVGQGGGQLCLSQPSPAPSPRGSPRPMGVAQHSWALGRAERAGDPAVLRNGWGPGRANGLAGSAQGGQWWPGGPGGHGSRTRASPAPSPSLGAPAPRQILRLSIFLFQDSGPNKVSRPLGLRGGIVRPHGRGARRPLPAEVGATSFTRVCARSLRAPLRARPCRATAGLRGPRRGRGGRRQAGDGKMTILTRRGEACGGDDGL